MIHEKAHSQRDGEYRQGGLPRGELQEQAHRMEPEKQGSARVQDHRTEERRAGKPRFHLWSRDRRHQGMRRNGIQQEGEPAGGIETHAGKTAQRAAVHRRDLRRKDQPYKDGRGTDDRTSRH